MDVRSLNRATLARQGLLARTRRSVPETVVGVVGVQAQEPAAPYVALWNRILDFDPAEVDRAFADGTVVKATLMRITLHAVARDDLPVLRSAMLRNLRAARLADRRFTDSGLTADDADAVVPALVAFLETPRDRSEVEAELESILGRRPPERLWWALRQCGPFVHAPTDDTWSFGRRPLHRSLSARERVPEDEAVQTLIRRYLAGYGPATVADVGRFALIQLGRLREAMATMDDLVELGDGLIDLGDHPLPSPDAPAPARLLGMWDNVLLAHADRSRVISDDHRAMVIRRNGDTLPTVLVDGFVAGVWRVVDGGVEVTPFRRLTGRDWADIDGEASALTWATERDASLFGRYDRWWAQLPDDGRRVVGV